MHDGARGMEAGQDARRALTDLRDDSSKFEGPDPHFLGGWQIIHQQLSTYTREILSFELDVGGCKRGPDVPGVRRDI